jgi:hypothetical protein
MRRLSSLLRFSGPWPGFSFGPERLEGPSEILVEEVDISVEREARGVVSEPALDLEDVAPFGEES